MKHKIQWLNMPGYKGETWNPIIGCSKVSDGCKNCYAEKMARRLAGIALKKDSTLSVAKYAMVINSGKWNGLTFFNQPELLIPAKWKSPRVVFVCSMGDLFFENHSFEHINAVFSVMADCDRHIFIVLTKRPQRMLEFYNWKSSFGIPWIPTDNIWMGVTTESQEQVNARLPHLIKIHAAVRFVSIEPMLSHVDISFIRSSSCSGYRPLESHPIGSPDRPFINWVICGGESGHNARPVHPDWVRSISNQCEAAGVPFFFKQWGELLPACQFESYKNTVLVNPKQFPSPHNPDKINTYYKVGKHKSGNKLDGKIYEAYPEFTPVRQLTDDLPTKSELQNKAPLPERSVQAGFRAGGDKQ